ncbi:NAD(P)H-dependent oxidoreductase [Lysinibacillus sphaericus]|uniref:NAD(P)H dehydrogenase (Quinone) n=1 Tax=Lysinibacillus sphaericus OT4b.31 TaxID=1285586 RepID=R7ZGC1_LYSSH|nr:NAD(P)H-dependent oxidoreductase [Lysinibacillus sphaericus]EON73081.1 NAD(P)H dehydrogenase (quinone) [Lysinibacillus sphaericus OT4b.31]
MKTLVIVSHPNLLNSRINKKWVEELSKYNKEITVHDIYKEYPDGNINVAREQELVEEHDSIIFQFPLQWFSTPPLLKKWLDDVLSYGWAYGSTGKALVERKIGLAISAGIRKRDFHEEGKYKFTLEEITVPFKATALYTGATFLPTFAVYGAENELSDQEVEQSAPDYVRHIFNQAKV